VGTTQEIWVEEHLQNDLICIETFNVISDNQSNDVPVCKRLANIFIVFRVYTRLYKLHNSQ